MKRIVPLLLCAVFIAACGDSSNGLRKKTAEQVVRDACGDKAVKEYRARTKGAGAVRKISVAREIARDCKQGVK